MKKLIISFSILLLIAATAFVGFKTFKMYETQIKLFFLENELFEDPEQRILALHDPNNSIKNEHKHFRLRINAQSTWKLPKEDLHKIAEEGPVLLTVEIWGVKVLDRISSGNFDLKIEQLLGPLASNPNLLIRFNPEMEIPGSKNTWSNWGQVYVEAFRRFSELARSTLPEAVIVWGPAGSMGNMEYYPGRKYFDAASISLEKEDKTDLFLKSRSVSEILKRKLHRMRFVDAPLLILGSPEAASEEILEKGFQNYQKAKDITHQKDIQPIIRTRTAPPLIGVYDPKKTLVNLEEVKVEHIFTGFKNIQNGSFKKAFLDVLSRGHDVIITVEPKNTGENLNQPDVLTQIFSGRYDPLFKKFYDLLPKEGPTIYLRFAHEMEIPVDRYPWQMQDPMLYIEAYRYFMKFPGSEAKNIIKIWGPAGDRGSTDWWPGSDVVDFISMSIYGLPDKNISSYREQDSFEKIFYRKKKRLDLFGKPFFITEFGVKGAEDYQKRWLLNAANVIQENKEIFGASYFNEQDLPEVWGEIEPPKWSISKFNFNAFTEALLQE